MTYYELLARAEHEFNNGYITLEGYEEMIKPLRQEIQSVQPEQKTGQWMEFDDYNTFRCSACGILWTTIEGTPIDNDMNFCPNCGAKMEVDDENT